MFRGSHTVLAALKIEGTVTSGSRTGKFYLGLQWVKESFREVAGYTPYPGTLNLLIQDEESRCALDFLRKQPGFPIRPQSGYYAGRFFKAKADGIDCLVVVPDAPSVSDIMELASEINLRKTLKLKDGDHLKVEVYIEQ